MSHNRVAECEPRATDSKIVGFLRYVRQTHRFEDESVLRVLLRCGYENEAFVLVSHDGYAVSAELLVTAVRCEAFVLALYLEGGTGSGNGFYIELEDKVAEAWNKALLNKLATRP